MTPTAPARKTLFNGTHPISLERIQEMKGLFRLLSSETRLRLLHVLIYGSESCVNDLAKAVGMKPQAVSNQLQRLADEGVIGRRREGTNVFYRLADPCVAEILDRALCLLSEQSEKR